MTEQNKPPAKLLVDEEVLTYAFRYTLGRQSYSVWTMTELLKKHWNEFTPNFRARVKKEILEADNGEWGLGMAQIDRPRWLAIVELP